MIVFNLNNISELTPEEPIIKSASELRSESIFSFITEAGENSKTTSSSIFFKSL